MVNVSLVRNTYESPMVKFSVTDTGIGMLPEVQHRLFEPYRQADRSTTRKFGGTGLGLTICKRLVILINGEMGGVSAAGHGRTFWVTVPFRHPSSSRISPIACPSLYGRHHCIVETHETIRFLLQHYDDSWGIVCDVARNGREGLSLIQERAKKGQPFEVAILTRLSQSRSKKMGSLLVKRFGKIPQLLALLSSSSRPSDDRGALDSRKRQASMATSPNPCGINSNTSASNWSWIVGPFQHYHMTHIHHTDNETYC